MALCLVLQVLALIVPGAGPGGSDALGGRVFGGVFVSLSCPALPGHALSAGFGMAAGAGHGAGTAGATGDERTPQCLDAAVLAIGGAPPKVLIAERTGDATVAFSVYTTDGHVVEEKRAAFPGPDAVPAFSEPEVLLKHADAAALADAHKLRKAACSALEAKHRAVVMRRLGKGRLALVLVTGKGRSELVSVPDEAVLRVQTCFDSAGATLTVAGQSAQEEGPGTPPRGFLAFVQVPTGEPLSDGALAGIWSEQGDLFFDVGRFSLAAESYEDSLASASGPRALFRSALSHAWIGAWKKSSLRVGQLDLLSEGEARVLQETSLHLPLLREARMRSIDINGSPDYSFKANKGFEGTSVWVKLKNKDGKSVAMFKPSNGNNYHRGDVFTYQMAKLLGTEDLYPVSILYTLDKRGCKKFAAALGEAKYKGPKERNRLSLLKQCQKGGLEGVVKEWVPDFVFFGAIGTTAKLQKHSVFRHLQRNGAMPEKGKTAKVQTKTKLYKPDNCKEATYFGVVDVDRLAQDLADVLVMDVLNANEDRFPGANIEFHSLGHGVEVKPCVFDFGASRLFSLDNGATFKGTTSNGFVDFTKRLKVSRFRRATFEKLEALQTLIKGDGPVPAFAAEQGIRNVADLTRFLALDKGDSHPRRKRPFDLFATNLRNVLAYMGKYEKDALAWFR